jgi:hypothetical protein
VAELVDAPDLKSVDFGRPGSIPGVPTKHLKMADVKKKRPPPERATAFSIQYLLA